MREQISDAIWEQVQALKRAKESVLKIAVGAKALGLTKVSSQLNKASIEISEASTAIWQLAQYEKQLEIQDKINGIDAKK